MKKMIFKMLLAPALLVVGVTLHPVLPVYARAAELVTKVVLAII